MSKVLTFCENLYKKRKDKNAQKQPSYIYFAFCIDFLICLLLYRYIGFWGLFISETIIIAYGLTARRIVNKQLSEEEKNSGIKIIDTMTNEDFANFCIKYFLNDYQISQRSVNEVDCKRFRILINDDDDEVIAYFVKSEAVTSHQVEELLDIMEIYKVKRGLLVTNGAVSGNAEVAAEETDVEFIGRDYFIKNSTAEKVWEYVDSPLYSYVKICPCCNSKLKEGIWFTGMRYECTNKKCDFRIAAKHLKK